MFDSVFVPCPRCGATLEYQSKAGPCHLNSYTLVDAPVEVKAGLVDERRRCNCGAIVGFMVQVVAIPYVVTHLAAT